MKCRNCASKRHDVCGYDPDTVSPVMSVDEALSAMLKRAVQEHGFDEAARCVPGLHAFGTREAAIARLNNEY